MPQSLRKPHIVRRRGEEDHPLQNQGETDAAPLPSSLAARSENEPDRRIEMARLLKSCGVKFYGPLAERYPAELIEAKVAEWRDDPTLGPGMLVRMIQEGGPVVEGLPGSGPEEDVWLERRYVEGKRRAGEPS